MSVIKFKSQKLLTLLSVLSPSELSRFHFYFLLVGFQLHDVLS